MRDYVQVTLIGGPMDMMRIAISASEYATRIKRFVVPVDTSAFVLDHVQRNPNTRLECNTISYRLLIVANDASGEPVVVGVPL